MAQYLFNSVPTIHRKRNIFDLSHKHFTDMNAGDLNPIYVQEVYPGDDFKIESAFISRVTSALLRPVMDNAYLDQMFFFVPSRLVYDKFKNVMGESEGAWAPSKTYSVPTFRDIVDLIGSTFSIPVGGVCDKMGIPTGKDGNPIVTNFANMPAVSLLPMRAFALVYNDWFRDENVEQPMLIQRGEVARSETPNNNAWDPSNYMGKLPKVNKFHDYFTSALPAPQKGDPVSLPIGDSAPIVGRDEVHVSTRVTTGFGSPATSDGIYPLLSKFSSSSSNFGLGIELAGSYSDVSLSGITTLPGNPIASMLTADLSKATSVDVNDLRTLTQLQRMLERDARGGTRYIEYVRSAFGVDSGDYRLQRSEFLGGRRTPLQVQQVPQTTGAGTVTEGESLGSLGAFSLSFGTSSVRKGFVEHGYIIGVACIRQKHTYQQGIEKFFLRSERTDFYDPVFQNLGEQPIYEAEIFQNLTTKPSDIFGYQEAWADLRQRPNRVSGALRSSSGSGLDIWHYADNFGSAPVLNKAFLSETESNINRSLAVPHTDDKTPQFILEFDFKVSATRVLPKFSVPGLLDHN